MERLGSWYRLEFNELIDGDHPLRRLKRAADHQILRLRPRIRSSTGSKAPVPPDVALRTFLYQETYQIDSLPQLVEAVRFDLRARWFLNFPVFGPMVTVDALIEMRERLETAGTVRLFLDAVEHMLEEIRRSDLIPDPKKGAAGGTAMDLAGAGTLKLPSPSERFVPGMPKLLTRTEVAEVMGIAEKTLRRIPHRKLPVIYVTPRRPRYRFEDVQKYMQQRKRTQ